MKKVFELEDLDCANCAMKMEVAIRKIEGIVDASVNFMTQKMTLEVADGTDMNAIIEKVVKVCKKVEPDCTIKR